MVNQDELKSLSSKESEVYILKVMYNQPSSIVEISQSLKNEDFFNYENRELFGAIKRISIGGEVSSEAIMSLLQTSRPQTYDLFKSWGGAPVLENYLRDKMPSNPSVSEHIKLIKSLTYRREAIEVSEKIKQAAFSNNNPETNKQFDGMEDLDEMVKEYTNSLSIQGDSKVLDSPVSNGLDELIDEIMRGDSGLNGISFGNRLPKLNYMFKNLQPTRLIAMVADAKAGKSSLMSDIAIAVAEKGIPILYLDSELSVVEYQIRMLSKLANVEQDEIRSGEFAKNETLKQRVLEAKEKLKNLPFYWINSNYMSNNELESVVKLYQLKHNIQLVIWDYLKADETDGRVDKIVEAKATLAKEKIAKQCNIPVLTAVQKNPNTGRATDSYGIYRIADLIFDWSKCDKDEIHQGTHKARMIMCRYGDHQGTIYFNMDGGKQQIKEW